MAASVPNTDTAYIEEAEVLEQLLEGVHDRLDHAEMTHNQLYATIGRYIECNEYISKEFRVEECSCCSYRRIVLKQLELEQALEADEILP